jgi:glycosyltransferase involved in cell wall biosynthesis
MAHILLLGSYAPSLVNFRGPLIRDMLAAKHRISVGAPDIPDVLRSHLVELGCEVHETPMDRNGTGLLADLRYFRGLRRLLAAVQPDVVLTYTIKPNIWGAFAAHSVGVPSVAMVTGLGYAFTETGIAPSPKQRLTGLIARRLYQNPDDKADFIRAGCLADPAKAGLINGSGVDMNHYLRHPLPPEPVVLMIARLLGNKGVRDYAEAAFQLRKSHPNARFQLVGPFDGGPDAITPQEVAAWTAQGLEYLGAAEDVRPYIANARIYVLPSYREGTPRSVLEAMAMGRPVVTTDVPGCRETVENGVNGLLVPVRNPSALADAIAYMLDHPEEAEAMGEAGFQLVALKYDVRLVNRAIMDLLGFPPASPHTATFMP